MNFKCCHHHPHHHHHPVLIDSFCSFKPMRNCLASFPLWFQLTNWLNRLLTHLLLLLFSHEVVSNSLQPHELKLTRLPCPSLYPRVDSDPCPLIWWCHPTISSSVPPSPPDFPSIRDFSSESAVHIRWPKYRSFFKSPIFKSAPSFGGIYKYLWSYFNQCQI